MGRSLASALDELGVGAGEARRRSSPQRGRFLVSLFGVSAYGRILVRSTSPQTRGDPLHPRALRALGLPSIRSSTSRCATSPSGTGSCSAPPAIRSSSCRAAAEPRHATTDENATASIITPRDHRAAQGVQLTHRKLLAERGHLRLAPGPLDRDCVLYTLPTFHATAVGHAVRVTGMGVPQVIIRKIDGEEILRRIDAEA